MANDWNNESGTGLFDGEFMPMLDEIIFDTNYMSALQMGPFDQSGQNGDDGLDAFRPAAFLNDLMDGSAKFAIDEDNHPKSLAKAGTSKGPAPKRKAANAAASPSKKARAPAASKSTKKTHLVPSSPNHITEAGAAPAAKIPDIRLAVPKGARKSINSSEEAGLKSMAQAAVTALIDNATSIKDQGAVAAVDTSTAHVKALAENSWSFAASGNAQIASSVVALGPKGSATAGAGAMNRAVRRQPLTADERASQNRDRNREHARNTRLRKKAYVDELKKTLVELVAQRDEAEAEKRKSAQMEAEQKEVRFRVIEEFLRLRGCNEPNASRWSAILDDGFSLTLPVTSYRAMVGAGASCEQVLNGVAECMADASYLSVFLKALGKDAALQYKCDFNEFIMDGCTGILGWEAPVAGSDIVLKGCFRAKFCPASNKLKSARMFFDTGFVQTRVVLPMKRNVSMGEIDQGASSVDANDADAFLSSIQIPRLTPKLPKGGTQSCVSNSGSEKDEELPSDVSLSDSGSEKGESNERGVVA